MIKKLLLFFCFTFLSTCYGVDLSPEESLVLKIFFYEMLEYSEGGYVLFDAKPVCIHSYYAKDDFISENPKHLSSVILREGSLVLKNRRFKEKNIIIHTYNKKDSLAEDYVHILFINKKLFLDVVQNNLLLFQYVLGPDVTAEKLLKKLTDPEQTFHSVLKCDKVLIGIILGFGTQNSLYGARIENLENCRFFEYPPQARCVTKFPHIPLEYKKTVFLNCMQHGNFEREVSYGYSSIEEEVKKSKLKMVVSSEKLETTNPNFIFGHLQDEESQALIAKLESTQEKIQELLSSEKFLEQTINLVFPEEKFNLPSEEGIQLCFFQEELKNLPYLVACNIWNNIAHDKNPYAESFIQGMKLAEEDKGMPDTPVNYWDFCMQNKLLEIKNNIDNSNEYFDLLGQNNALTRVSNLPLYYKILKNGKGNPVKSFTEVFIRYSIEYPDGDVIVDTFKAKTPEKLDLHTLIPGFALGIIGMQKDEERELFIHPSLAYGILTALRKGVYIKARIQLIDSIESDQKEGIVFSNVEILDLNKELTDLGMLNEKKRLELCKSTGLTNGYQIWQHYKKGSFYTLQQILEWIRIFETTKTDHHISSFNDQNLINRLHWNLYHYL
jgi:FKBP-type peptidyl-prolyl cis-trans isomerase